MPSLIRLLSRVSVMLALLGTNQSPLKAALLEQKLGADIDIGFDDSTLQPTLELVLRGATAETAPKFAAGVKQAVTDLLAGGIPEELLLASLNAMEFASLERPGSLPDGVLDVIYAATGWLHTGDPALLLHTDKLFASLREKLSTGWFNDLLKDLLLAEPVQVIQTPALPKKDEEDAAPARNDGKLVLDHPLTVADLGDGDRSAAGTVEPLAGAELLHHPSKGSLYLNFYYDLGECIFGLIADCFGYDFNRNFDINNHILKISVFGCGHKICCNLIFITRIGMNNIPSCF